MVVLSVRGYSRINILPPSALLRITTAILGKASGTKSDYPVTGTVQKFLVSKI